MAVSDPLTPMRFARWPGAPESLARDPQSIQSIRRARGLAALDVCRAMADPILAQGLRRLAVENGYRRSLSRLSDEQLVVHAES